MEVRAHALLPPYFVREEFHTADGLASWGKAGAQPPKCRFSRHKTPIEPLTPDHHLPSEPYKSILPKALAGLASTARPFFAATGLLPNLSGFAGKVINIGHGTLKLRCNRRSVPFHRGERNE
jgi:hypothetical protein